MVQPRNHAIFVQPGGNRTMAKNRDERKKLPPANPAPKPKKGKTGKPVPKKSKPKNQGPQVGETWYHWQIGAVTIVRLLEGDELICEHWYAGMYRTFVYDLTRKPKLDNVTAGWRQTAAAHRRLIGHRLFPEN